jgi:hypothetical protein
MEEIEASKVLFIKLGRKGSWEKECIEMNQTLRLGYREVDHSECLKGNWKASHDYYLNVKKGNHGTATSHTNQIRYFYESGETVLWITFYANKLWWCFSKLGIQQLPDKTKIRSVIDKWSDTDILGKELTTDSLSGKLLKTQGFRGTICEVPESEYVLLKINSKELSEVTEAKEALQNLELKISYLIRQLQCKDFEILIDLIFRQAGWQRLGVAGKAEKTLDLDLLSPVTNEKAIVQIKSSSNFDEFQRYVNEFKKMKNYDKLFYVVHSPEKKLMSAIRNEQIKLLLLDDITKLSINSGLIDWIIKKAS